MLCPKFTFPFLSLVVPPRCTLILPPCVHLVPFSCFHPFLLPCIFFCLFVLLGSALSIFETPASVREFWKPAPLLEFWNASPYFRILKASTSSRVLKCHPLFSNFECQHLLSDFESPPMFEFWNASPYARILKGTFHYRNSKCHCLFSGSESQHLLLNFDMPAHILEFCKLAPILESTPPTSTSPVWRSSHCFNFCGCAEGFVESWFRRGTWSFGGVGVSKWRFSLMEMIQSVIQQIRPKCINIT